MLYLAFSIDLRDRFKGAVWLAYAGKVQETEFHAEDTLVIGEWMFPHRDTLLQTLSRVRQSGVRVVFIGQSARASDDFKRELYLLGIYDFLFVGDELVLQDLDELLKHPRSASDVAVYLSRDEGPDVEAPKLVDVFEGDGEPFVWEPLDDVEDTTSPQFDALFQPGAAGKLAQGDGRHSPSVRRFVWPDPTPLCVRILGESGCGKSFVALQLASLCHGRDLQAAVVEEHVEPLRGWCEEPLASHIYDAAPPKGYRVILDTRADGDTLVSEIDIILLVTWPDTNQLKDTLQRLDMLDRVMCIVNHASTGIAPGRADSMVYIPHEPRQFHAMRMRTPLVDLDPRFAEAFLPVVERISTRYMDPNRTTGKGGEPHALVAGD
ncbi:hypothetical protein [Alicyclobacillus sp. ALC3]|uniref:hypothetical protein n=1 Tax=Alicyclobacillus sp. ALC3 TaxID=2796143 RepID=UPI002379442D|nr:hypothetical protein [Alicyclobacillus sp. ALC3]WDL96745.1 hypothetical protein JC200_21010 [Alicyclobacillus sp. ALC3]